MKKILALCLAAVFLTGLWGCSAPILYDEELAALRWVEEHTEGYTKLADNQRKIYKDSEGFIFNFRVLSGGIPQPQIEYDPTSTTVTEEIFLTASVNGEVFASASSLNRVFHPYRNTYESAMQIYRKDDSHFRIFLWLYGEDTDFYPIPRLLTQEQYEAMLPLIRIYNEEKYVESENDFREPINYEEIFLNAYEGTYLSEKVTNPDGVMFYEYNGTADEYTSDFATVFSQLNLTEQDWREAYESLGYTGTKSVYQILYFDVAVGNTIMDLTLYSSDVYTSPALQEKNLTFTYDFCPTLAKQEFMNVTQQ